VTEARSPSGELFGFDRLVETLHANRHLEPQALVESVHEAVIAFSQAETFPDDLTCVVLKVEEGHWERGQWGNEENAQSSDAPVSPLPAQEQALAQQEMEVSSALTELARIRAFVRAFCRAAAPAPLDEDRLNLLELAVNEAASNMMRHAYGGRTDQRIQVE